MYPLFWPLSSSVLDDLSKFTKTNNKIFIPHPIYDSFGKIVEKEIAKSKLGLDIGGKYLLFFGFIRKYKGLDIMLEVMSDKRIQDLGIKLIIKGEFYENQKEYITKIQDLNISDYVILNNFIPESEVKNYFFVRFGNTNIYFFNTKWSYSEMPIILKDLCW